MFVYMVYLNSNDYIADTAFDCGLLLISFHFNFTNRFFGIYRLCVKGQRRLQLLVQYPEHFQVTTGRAMRPYNTR